MKFGLVDKKGNEVIPCIYDEIGFGKDGFFEVKLNRKPYYVDFFGNKYNPNVHYHQEDGIDFIDGFLCNKYYDSYSNSIRKITRIPLYDFKYFLICRDVFKNKYIYDKLRNKYISLGNKCIEKCSDNTIVIDKETYYFKDNEIINLGCYFLDGKNLLYPDLLISFDEFKAKYKEDSSLLFNLKSKIDKLIDEKRLSVIKETANKEKEKKELIKKEKEARLDEILSMITKINELATDLDDFSTSFKSRVLDSKIIFISKVDHKEINPSVISILPFIDLSLVSFDNVKVDGIDFSNTNADIDPQKVYKKNMSRGNYSTLNFNLKNFTGVDISGSIFDDATLDFAFNFRVKGKVRK